jgi:ribosomal-protein-alanine N-acetyltransferase
MTRPVADPVVDVVVGPLRWWHLTEVAALEAVLFPRDAWSLEQFWGELAQPTRVYRGAWRDGRLVGYAGAFVLPPDSDVQTVAVHPEEQGHGVGGRLLAPLMTEAARRGCRTMMLEVRAGNEPALALYARHGFERVARRSAYYPDGEDALILRAPLAAR